MPVTQRVQFNLAIAPRTSVAIAHAFQAVRMFFPLAGYTGCGTAFSFPTSDAMPLVDTPCPCATPGCWLVKWSPAPAAPGTPTVRTGA